MRLLLPLVLAAAAGPAVAAEVARPRIVGLSHVALFVKDIEAARAFYKGFLGFDEPYSLCNADGTLALTFIKINDRQTVELFPEREAGSDRLNHVSVETDDVEALRAYLAAKGVAGVPVTVPRGRTRNSNFTIKDPDGHGVEFVQYEPDGWTMREKGKYMPATRVSARMRHAGILVGDLDASRRFYRDILGFRETWRGSRDGKVLSWVNLEVPDGDDYLELMLYEKLPAPDARGVPHHICLEVEDVPKAAQSVEGRVLPPGCKAPSPLRTGVNGKRQINFYDPDTTRIEIMEPDTHDGKPVPPSDAPPPVVSR
jgi:catechol 2,3-dioxygenase-like lactoylglutathione lyase family enzyme